MSKEERGLFTKYIVFKRLPCACGGDTKCKDCHGDGFRLGPVAPEAQYFLLRIDEQDWHGEASRLALATYAAMAEKHNLTFAIDLHAWLAEHDKNELKLFVRNGGKAARTSYEQACAHWEKMQAEGFPGIEREDGR